MKDDVVHIECEFVVDTSPKRIQVHDDQVSEDTH